jgi:hypothetical protein
VDGLSGEKPTAIARELGSHNREDKVATEITGPRSSLHSPLLFFSDQ